MRFNIFPTLLSTQGKKKSDDGFTSLNFSGCEGSKISPMFLFIDCSQDETIGSLSKFITSL